eukprot:scaffold118791_cov21-Tisochrysis_lutea.AAC.1
MLVGMKDWHHVGVDNYREGMGIQGCVCLAKFAGGLTSGAMQGAAKPSATNLGAAKRGHTEAEGGALKWGAV